MPIISGINQYSGINAHFQSYAQNTYDGWSSFHSQHIADLTRAIDKLLRGTGYRVDPQRSLQIKRQDLETGKRFSKSPRPDVLIRSNPQGHKPLLNVAGNLATPMIIQKLLETEYFSPLEEPYDAHAVVIKRDETEVARIEVLSPTNKRPGKERRDYIEKRADTLRSGVVLVEVDYLHETPSLTIGVPDYLAREAQATPYTISVIDPKPAAEMQKMIYGFKVDAPVMPVPVPLWEEDKIIVDFGGIYTETFNSLETFSLDVDYSRTPLNFASYHRDDQIKIWARMLAVADARRAGVDIDNLSAPLPAKADDPALQQVVAIPYERAALLIDDASYDAVWLVQQPFHASAHQLIAVYRSLDQQGQVLVRQREMASGNRQVVEASYDRLEQHLDQHGVVVEGES